MNCQQAQHELLSAECFDIEALAPAVAAHANQCPDCQAVLAELRMLEFQASRLPVPAGAAEHACFAFLQSFSEPAEAQTPAVIRHLSPVTLESRAAALARLSPDFPRDGRDEMPLSRGADLARGNRRARWTAAARRGLAAAAAIAIVVTIVSFVLFSAPQAQAETVLEDLVNWNLAIAQAPTTADRGRVYARQVNQMKHRAANSSLKPAERALANSLLENARWLTTNIDPADEAARFKSLADQFRLHGRAHADSPAAAHWNQLSRRLLQGSNGVDASPALPRQIAPAEGHSANQTRQDIAPSRNQLPVAITSAAEPLPTPVAPYWPASHHRAHYPPELFPNPAPAGITLSPGEYKSDLRHASRIRHWINGDAPEIEPLASAGADRSTQHTDAQAAASSPPAHHADVHHPSWQMDADQSDGNSTPASTTALGSHHNPLGAHPMNRWLADQLTHELSLPVHTDPGKVLPHRLHADGSTGVANIEIKNALISWINQNSSAGDLPANATDDHPMSDPRALFSRSGPSISLPLGQTIPTIFAVPEPDMVLGLLLFGLLLPQRKSRPVH